MLTKEDIDELKSTYKKEKGEELSDEEAWEMGHRLIRLFDVLTRVKPVPPQTQIMNSTDAVTVQRDVSPNDLALHHNYTTWLTRLVVSNKGE